MNGTRAPAFYGSRKLFGFGRKKKFKDVVLKYKDVVLPDQLVIDEPSFDGVGDERFGLPDDPSFSEERLSGPINEGPGDEDVMLGGGVCAWCGSPGAHKPGCKALTAPYPVSSLTVQREMTLRMREEMDRVMYGSKAGGVGGSATTMTTNPKPPDTRTEVQKRFDAIAEELKET
jgi:hypothetical protein